MNIDNVRESANLARKIWQEIKLTSVECSILNREMFTNVKKLKSYPKIHDNSTVEVVLARFDKIQFFDSEVLDRFKDYFPESNVVDWLEIFRTSSNSYFSEWHAMLRKYEGSPIRKYWYDFNECRVIILPLLAKSGIDYGNLHVLTQWVRTPIPFLEPNSTYPLSLEFESVGLYDLAWRVQMEDGHRYYDDPHFSGNSNYHSYYLRAAQNSYRAGNKDVGWAFLMNAAVFEEEKSFDLAMETAQLWIDIEAGRRKLPEQKIVLGDERKKVFLEIVERYRAINAHPRAWLFIKENKKEFDNPDELTQKIQDDWLHIVGVLMNEPFKEKIIMYGVELYPQKNDPLSVEVPWAFSEGSVEKVKKKIHRLADKIKKEEDKKDGFANWYFGDNNKLVKAKYISCNDNFVIIEKVDGTKESIEITKLGHGNKSYVYRRLALRNLAIEDFCTLYHDWQSADNQVVCRDAKYLSLDDKIITLELKDGKKEEISLSNLNKTEQEYINLWETWETKKRKEAEEKQKEQLQEQKSQLSELRKKLLSEVQFRYWHSKDGIFRTNAKYISYDFKQRSVTIEKEDGKQITLDFSDLCKEDQQYLRDLLNPKLPGTKNKQ
ncbi:MAG: CCDC34 family protein [Planctomycetaceae bacterium]|nr:CCDC34 family protein [Planctomycetaceae bacterium]